MCLVPTFYQLYPKGMSTGSDHQGQLARRKCRQGAPKQQQLKHQPLHTNHIEHTDCVVVVAFAKPGVAARPFSGALYASTE